MIKLFVTLIVILILIVILKNSLNIANKTEVSDFKKYPIECKLFNEIIDRDSRDSERQCYYKCNEEIIRVDTSIEYICQPFIIEER